MHLAATLPNTVCLLFLNDKNAIGVNKGRDAPEPNRTEPNRTPLKYETFFRGERLPQFFHRDRRQISVQLRDDISLHALISVLESKIFFLPLPVLLVEKISILSDRWDERINKEERAHFAVPTVLPYVIKHQLKVWLLSFLFGKEISAFLCGV